MRFKFQDSGLSSGKYFLYRVLPHLAMFALILTSVKLYWTPIAGIEQTIPGFVTLLIIVYAMTVTGLYWLLARTRLRVITILPVLAAVVAVLFVAATSRPTGGEFVYFFRKYVWYYALTFMTLGCLAGIGLARWKYFHFADIVVILTGGVYFFTILDKFTGKWSYVMVFLLFWYAAHTLILEQYFLSWKNHPDTGERLKRDYIRKYLVYMVLFLSLFLLLSGFPSLLKQNIVKEAKSPYSNQGRLDQNDPEPSHYIHDLDPYVSLEDEIKGSDRVLLFNVYVRKYNQWKEKYPFLYLQQYAMAKYDDRSLQFRLDESDPKLAAFFPGLIPTHAMMIPPQATFPLFVEELTWFRLAQKTKKGIERDKLEMTVRLTPFVRDHTIISLNFPTYLSVIEQVPVETILSNVYAKYGKTKEGFGALERSFKTTYAVEALALPVNLENMSETLLERAADNRPEVRLSSLESNYYVYYGDGSGGTSSNFIHFTRELLRGKKTRLDKARTIISFYRDTRNRSVLQGERFHYSLKPGPPTPEYKGNYLDYFIFENRKGYCQYYALASALMFRIAGIPSRVAGGYLGVDRSAKNPGYFYVYAHQAHAWTEIFLDGIGWVALDVQPYEEGEYLPPSADGTPPDPPPGLPETSRITVGGMINTLYPEDRQMFMEVAAFQIGLSNGPVYDIPEYVTNRMRMYRFTPSMTLKTIQSNRTNILTNIAPETLYDRHSPEFYMDIALASGTFDNDQIREKHVPPDKIVFEVDELVIDKDNLSIDSLTNKNTKSAAKVSLSAPLLVLLICLLLTLSLFMATPVILAFYRWRMNTVKDDALRLALFVDYATLRVFLLGENTYGYSRKEWVQYLFDVHGLDFRSAMNVYVHYLYDPYFSPTYTKENLLADSRVFQDSLRQSPAYSSLVRFLSLFLFPGVISFRRARKNPKWRKP